MGMSRRRSLSWLLATVGASVAGPGRLLAQTKPSPGPPVGQPWPPMTEAEVFSKDGTPIFYRHGGAGTLNVIFVHGWSCHHAFFGPQFSPVAADYRVFALDVAGHGSSGSRKHHTLQDFGNDVLAVAAQSDGPLVLVVHSAGGRIACNLAHRLGERLLGIIGIDSFQNLGLPKPSEERVVAALEALRANFRHSVAQSVSRFFPQDADPALRAWVQEQMTATDPTQAIAAAESFGRADPADMITGFSRPVITLNSDGVPTNSDKIRAFLPEFEARILPGQGHFPHLLSPETFNPELLSILQHLFAT